MLNKRTINGMKDILPEEMKIRNYVINLIQETYSRYGFSQIETPCMESLENLNCKEGGENEKLIYKTIKRKESLKLSEATCENDIVDNALRYDLTLPLVRYYANNIDKLPNPFKALQMGNVWRADRPQRGRFRQFMQCDIDVLGDASNLVEVELILATTEVLSKLEFNNFEVRINDRRILKAILEYLQFPEESFNDVFIILDKMDKIGLDGIKEELIKNGFDEKLCINCFEFFNELKNSFDSFSFIENKLEDLIDIDVLNSFKEIIDNVNFLKNDNFKIIFDPTLIRGMSYYTGTIFEITLPGFGGSCGGGGRYDKMVEKFIGKNVPACGFSLGFERIVMLLMEKNFKIPGENKKIAYLIEKGIDNNTLLEILKEVQFLRKYGAEVLVVWMNKNKKFQKEQLAKNEFYEFKEFYKEPLKK